MHYAKAVSPLVTVLTVFALASEAIAAADDDAKDIRRRHRMSQILIRQDSPRLEAGKSWIESHMALRKGIGIVYRYKTETEEKRKLVFSVGGPVLKKKRFGMMFEVRF
jgi:hypothetical protein